MTITTKTKGKTVDHKKCALAKNPEPVICPQNLKPLSDLTNDTSQIKTITTKTEGKRVDHKKCALAKNPEPEICLQNLKALNDLTNNTSQKRTITTKIKGKRVDRKEPRAGVCLQKRDLSTGDFCRVGGVRVCWRVLSEAIDVKPLSVLVDSC